ncbi:MAG: glutamate--tRNA ligase [Crocinitomicaceae bacterium]
MSEKKVRVRFAPSPTGPLHVGGVRTALYNYLFAKHHGGQFILRLEDTDQTRFVPGAEEYIIESLKWAGISPDEGQGFGGEYGPYKQSERKAMYKPYADQLIADGKAYYAFDTPEELDQMRENAKQMGMPNWQYNSITRSNMKNSLSLSAEEVEERLKKGDPYVIRIKMPRDLDIKFEDIIRGWVSVNTNNLDDKVLFKSDGMPTYHLANIVDDRLMEITHVIRGEEWLPSAPLHVFLYDAFGWEAPKFAHLPLILKPDGPGKLSKRDGDRLGFPVFPLNWTNSDGEIYSGYKESGYFPDAFVNILAFLGWNPGDERELFTLEELSKEFKLERVGKSGAKFDPDKAKWYNQQYLRKRSAKELADLLQSYIGENNLKTSPFELEPVCELMKERATFIKDIYEDGHYFFAGVDNYDEKTLSKKWKENTSALMSEWLGILKNISSFNADSVENEFKDFITNKELGLGAVLPNFRLLLTGVGSGPSLFSIAEILGKEECIKRMEAGIEKINELKSQEA